MNASHGLIQVANGLRLLQNANILGQLTFFVWIFTGSLFWAQILWGIAGVMGLGGLVLCCLGPSWPIRLLASLTLALALAVTSINLQWPEALEEWNIVSVWLLKASPLLGLLLFLGSLLIYCQRESPGEGQQVLKCLAVWAVCLPLFLVGLNYNWLKSESTVVFLGILGVGILAAISFLLAFAAAEEMARRVAARLGSPGSPALTGESLPAVTLQMGAEAEPSPSPVQQFQDTQADASIPGKFRAAGILLLVLSGAAIFLTVRAAMVMGNRYTWSAAVFAAVFVFGLVLVAVPIDPAWFQSDKQGASAPRFADLPMAWKVLPIAALAASIASWCAIAYL